MATKYILKRKTFGITNPFKLTRSHFNAMGNAWKAGDTSTMFKEAGKAAVHGGAGLVKGGLAAGGIAAAVGAKPVFDKLTGEDINKPDDSGLY